MLIFRPFLIAVSLVFVLGIATDAYALALDQAKSQGLVGEKSDGYLGVVQPNPEAQNLVKEINDQRRSKYQEIASKNGTAIGAVEALAGKKAIELTPPGQFVQTNAGWKKK